MEEERTYIKRKKIYFMKINRNEDEGRHTVYTNE